MPRRLVAGGLASIFVILALTVSVPGGSAPSVASAGGAVVFTFDDGYASDVNASAILESRGARGTFYVASGMLRSGAFFTDYLSAQDLTALAARGHDVESMTRTAPLLTTASPGALLSELSGSKYDLQSLTGMPVAHLAFPYGATNASVVNATSSYYTSARVLAGSVNEFAAPMDAFHMPALPIARATTLASAQADVDFARARGTTVILEFQRILDSPGANDWSSANLSALLDYTVAQGVAIKTVAQLFPAPAPIPPVSPTLQATVGNGTLQLAWATPPNGGSPILGYKVYRGTGVGTETLLAQLAPNATSYLDANVSRGQTYDYEVTAWSLAGEGIRQVETRVYVPLPGVTPGAVVYTFLGGLASGRNAASILESHGQRGTFFVSPTLLNQGIYYTSFLSAADLASLAQRGHDVESMTSDQLDLTTLPPATLSLELSDSRLQIQNITGRPVRELAYPYGATNANVTAAASANYAAAQTLTWNAGDFLTPPSDPYHMPAMVMMNSTSLATAETYVALAATYNVSVTFAFGDINATASAYAWTPSDLDALSTYVSARGVPVLTLAQQVSRMPLAPTSPPDAPILTDIPRNGTVNLTWTIPDNHGAPILGYRVYRDAIGNAPTLYASLGSSTVYTDANVTNNLTYRYQVSATNAMGESARSNLVAGTPTALGIPPGAAVVFTFDDGLISQMSSQGVLDQHGFKATYFIIPTNLSNPATGDNPEFMAPSDVKALAADGMDMESHTDNHVDQTQLTDAQLVASLAGGRFDLENITGKAANYLAWPFGVSNPRTQAVAAQYYLGARSYSTDLSIAEGHATSPFTVPAFGVTTNDTAQTTGADVDYAIAHNETIIFVIHNLAPIPANAGIELDQWDWNLNAFTQLVSYVASTHVPVMTIAQLAAAGRMPPN